MNVGVFASRQITVAPNSFQAHKCTKHYSSTDCEHTSRSMNIPLTHHKEASSGDQAKAIMCATVRPSILPINGPSISFCNMTSIHTLMLLSARNFEQDFPDFFLEFLMTSTQVRAQGKSMEHCRTSSKAIGI